MNQNVTKATKFGDRLSPKQGRLTYHRRSRKTGLSPGSLIHIGTERAETVTISAIDYSEKEFQQKDINNVQDLAPYLESSETTWIRVQELRQTTQW